MNVWESLNVLVESQAGSIIRILGMHKEWAELFHRKYGAHAFSIAKLARFMSPNDPSGQPWGQQPTEPVESELWYVMGGIVQMVDVVENEKQLLDMLQKSPKLVKAINSFQLSGTGREQIRQMFRDVFPDILATKPDPADVFMQVGQGWYWLDLKGSYCDPESKMMGHCGHDERGNLYSLRDPKNKPHVTLTYDPSKNIVFQIKGKQNQLPGEKYWPAIEAFFEKTDAKLGDDVTIGSPLGDALSRFIPEISGGPICQTQGGVWESNTTSDDLFFLILDEPIDDGNVLPEAQIIHHDHGSFLVVLEPPITDGQMNDLYVALKGMAEDDPARYGHYRDLLPSEKEYVSHVNRLWGREESIRLEHARMMGPVAYAEALARLEGVHGPKLVEFLTDLSPNRKEAIQMLSDVISDNWDLLAQRGVDPEGLKYLGTGNNGTAWQMRDGRVLKITTDDAEAHVASALRGKQFKHVFTVFDVWAFPGQINGHHIYGLVSEGGLQKPSQQDQDEFDNMALTLMEVEESSGKTMEEDLRGVLTYLMADPDIEPLQKRITLEAVKKFNVPGMMADMKRIGFVTDLHSGNFMQRKDGTFVIIDIGTGGDQEDSKPPFLEGHLDLDGRLDEVGILGAPQAGSGSQMRGMGSTAWSGGKLVLADPKDHVPVDEEDEEAQYLDQDRKGLGPNGSNSPY